MTTLDVKIVSLDAGQPAEPAQAADSVGVCLSGGGSRALACAMGQLRALRHLGLLDRVAAISSVSGGTWANVLFTYLPDTIGDDEFLGPVELDPSQLTWEALGQMAPHNLGQVPCRLGVLKILEQLTQLADTYASSDLWQAVVGRLVLGDFGLWQPEQQDGFDPHYFSGTAAYLAGADGPLARNPQLDAGAFYTVQRPRPLPIFNASVFVNDGDDADLVPFEANSLLGVRAVFDQPGQLGVIGGGLIDSFAMGSSYLAERAAGEVETSVPLRPFSLNDIAGCSSVAPAEYFEEKFRQFSGLVPRYPYWPVHDRAVQPLQSYRFADGGNLENLGIMPLLARGFARLLVLVNTDQGVALDPESGETVVSGDIPPLFGLQPFSREHGYVPYSQDPGSGPNRMYRHSQVFPTEAFAPLQQALLAAKRAGGSLLVRQTLEVLANPWFDVPAQAAVEVLWVHNDSVRAWSRQLPDATQVELDLLSLDDFPLYGTITQLHLPPTLVNAVAHLSCWNLASDSTVGNPGGQSNAEVVRGLFG